MFRQNGIQWYAYVWVNPPRAMKRPSRGAEGPTFLFIKIESWNFIRIYGEKWYAYIWVDSHMSCNTAPLGGRRPPLLKTFLFIKTEDWNLVSILFIQNEIQWYAYVLVNFPQSRETALIWGRRPHFFVNQYRKLKFRTNIWRTMICDTTTTFMFFFTRQRRVYQLVSNRGAKQLESGWDVISIWAS